VVKNGKIYIYQNDHQHQTTLIANKMEKLDEIAEKERIDRRAKKELYEAEFEEYLKR